MEVLGIVALVSNFKAQALGPTPLGLLNLGLWRGMGALAVVAGGGLYGLGGRRSLQVPSCVLRPLLYPPSPFLLLMCPWVQGPRLALWSQGVGGLDTLLDV